jgi:hypothetical protein
MRYTGTLAFSLLVLNSKLLALEPTQYNIYRYQKVVLGVAVVDRMDNPISVTSVGVM